MDQAVRELRNGEMAKCAVHGAKHLAVPFNFLDYQSKIHMSKRGHINVKYFQDTQPVLVKTCAAL